MVFWLTCLRTDETNVSWGARAEKMRALAAISTGRVGRGPTGIRLSTANLWIAIVTVLGFLGLIALVLPQYREAAMLLAAGIALALARFLLFTNAPGRSSAMRSRRRVGNLHVKKTS